MLARACFAAAAFALAAPAFADHYPGHNGSIYGPRNGTGTNIYTPQPNSGSDPYHQPRRPRVEPEWDQYRSNTGADPWRQPRQPDVYPWGKPKY